MTRPPRARNETAAPATLAIPGQWAERALCAQADPDAGFPGHGQLAAEPPDPLPPHRSASLGLVHVWSTCHRSRAVPNGLQW